MKRFTTIVFFIISSLYFTNASSQVKLIPSQVKEILILNAEGGMMSGSSVSIKVISDKGIWKSYLIGYKKPGHRIDKKLKPTVYAPLKYITTIHPIYLNALLNGIANLKPNITASTFHLTPDELISGLKSIAKKPIINTPYFEKLITQKSIDEAIAKTVSPINIMDVFSSSEIDIITNSNDTVKLQTRNLCATKLPWSINDKHTYDMAINNFVVAAIDTANVPNKRSLSITSLKSSIYKYIDDHNIGAPIATFRWKYAYPSNLKLLMDHFTVSEKLMDGDIYWCTVQTKTMPKNAILECWINMERKQDIERVIRYAALIDKYFKTDNFVLKYYSGQPEGHIGFYCHAEKSPYPSLSYLRKNYLNRLRPILL